jgi:hypothetical protein
MNPQMNAQKNKMAQDLFGQLKKQFKRASISVGHGIALDKDKNASYYFKIHCSQKNVSKIGAAAEAFLKATYPNDPIIVRATDLQNQDASGQNTYDLGVGYIGAGIRNKY